MRKNFASGNDDVVLEKLDVSLLINQALGEHDNEIQNSGLPFCVDTPKELFISADGRKMSRVVSNLINNILKYTMKNTRVFITAYIVKPHIFVFTVRSLSANADKVDQHEQCNNSADNCVGKCIDHNAFL